MIFDNVEYHNTEMLGETKLMFNFWIHYIRKLDAILEYPKLSESEVYAYFLDGIGELTHS